MKKLSYVVFASLALSACSSRYASHGEASYLQSRNGVTLEVPPPLTNVNVSHFYDLPSQNEDARVAIKPPQ